MLLRILLKVALVAETSAGSGENVSVELPRLATLMRDLGSTELPLSAENVVAPRKRAESGFQRVSLLAGAHNASDATAWPPSTLNIRARKNAAEARSNKQPSEVWRITSPSERSHIKSGNVSPCGNDDYERPDLMASALNIVEDTSHRYQPLQAAALRLSTRAAAGSRLTSANSYDHHEGDPIPEAEQGALRDSEDILDPKAVPTHGCPPSATVCSKEISARPGHPRSRARNHRGGYQSRATLRCICADAKVKC
ncbi:hypothetical protein MRX96_010877 [Rhipicephalus microplus]